MKSTRFLFAAAAAALMLWCGGCGEGGREEAAVPVIRVADGGRIVSLDPVLAADLRSQRLVNAFFDTLLAYRYPGLPYELEPSMLAARPEVAEGGAVYRFRLRDDLFFQRDPCFGGADDPARKIDADAVIFSLLRLADCRLHSATYSLFRGKIAGFEEFYAATADAAPGDFSMYDAGVPGLRRIDELSFEIRLESPDPRFLYLLAIPCTGVVSRRAVELYGPRVGDHPVGSGPFVLESWQREYKIIMNRNPDYRRELFAAAANPADRERPLPLAERIECITTRQPQASWLLFLQGELDLTEITRDNIDIVTADGERLAPVLAERGIELLRSPALEVQYIGFSFTDARLGSSLPLRRAISMAYNIPRLIEYANYLMLPASGPLPPGVPGYDPDFVNSWGEYNLEKARQQLALAGYPEGCDPMTGERLTFTIDMNGNSALHRQIGELFAADMARIGIEIIPVLNNSPRFYQKLGSGQVQLFRLSWKGDYPDAENFLQLFYSGNIGGANRVGYSNAVYDDLFRRYLETPAGPESGALLGEMCRKLASDAPWIFESIPVSYQLKHGWLENFHPHDFAYGAWKYLALRGGERERARREFAPLHLDQLN